MNSQWEKDCLKYVSEIDCKSAWSILWNCIESCSALSSLLLSCFTEDDKIKAKTRTAVSPLLKITSVFVEHCLGPQQGDNSHTRTQRKRWSPPFLGYTFRHNALLALCRDYRLNGMGADKSSAELKPSCGMTRRPSQSCTVYIRELRWSLMLCCNLPEWDSCPFIICMAIGCTKCKGDKSNLIQIICKDKPSRMVVWINNSSGREHWELGSLVMSFGSTGVRETIKPHVLWFAALFVACVTCPQVSVQRGTVGNHWSWRPTVLDASVVSLPFSRFFRKLLITHSDQVCQLRGNI